MVQDRPEAGDAPAPEIAVHRRPGWEIRRQLPPLGARPEQVEDRVEHGTHIRRSRPAPGLRGWHQPTVDLSGPKGTAFAACSPPYYCFQRRSYQRRPDTLHTASESAFERATNSWRLSLITITCLAA